MYKDLDNKTNTMGEEWDQFINSMYQPTVDSESNQYQDMKKSFFAGAQCFIFLSIKLANQMDSEEGYQIFLNNLQEEVFASLISLADNPEHAAMCQRLLDMYHAKQKENA